MNAIGDLVRWQLLQPSTLANEPPSQQGPAPLASPDGEIPCDAARTLPGLLARRVELTPSRVAYRQYEGNGWRDYDWQDVAERVARWQRGLSEEGLQPGDRVAMSLPNGVDWVCFDLAALGLGLVTVPIYTTDSPGNFAHILEDSGARLLVLESDERWATLAAMQDRFPRLERVLCMRVTGAVQEDTLLRDVDGWLPPEVGLPRLLIDDCEALATLIYTSGTTGPAKGVMLSHRNNLWNAEAVLRRIPALPTDVFLSFLPLAHSFERTVGYYLPMMAGCSVAYARSVEKLREDLLTIRPTVLLSVPRLYDKIYLAIQAKVGEHGLKRRLLDKTVAIGWRRFEAAGGRAPKPDLSAQLAWPLLCQLVARPVLNRLGGRLRVAVSGGAPLSPTVARFFIGLGLPLTEGYGLTEAAPVVSSTPPEGCMPGWVGRALPGVQTRLGAQGELLVRGPGVMQGYWNQPDATARAIDADGWLHTGDVAEIREGYVAIRGRLKEILVTSTGEKVPPVDMEMALTMDPLFDQAMVVGEGRSHLVALLVLAPEHWRAFAAGHGLDPADRQALTDPGVVEATLARVAERLADFPGHAQVRAVHLSLSPWTVDNGLLTPTMKTKRPEVEARFAAIIDALYAHHEPPTTPGG